MLEWFDHHGHVCIVFELLGLSTYDFIKENSFLPFQIDHIRQMAYQICQSINCKYTWEIFKHQKIEVFVRQVTYQNIATKNT